MTSAAIVGVVLALSLFTAARALPPRDSARSLDPTTVTISGISAGGAFAMQYQFAYSSAVRGAAIAAGLPYYCAQDLEAYALMCMSNELIDLDTLIFDASLNADFGLIEPLAGLQSHNVWLWSGLYDTVVNHGAMVWVEKMYQQLNVSHVVSVFNYSAEHAWPTSDFGNACSHLGRPYINNCGYDFGGNFLADTFTRMGLKWNQTMGVYNPANMLHFDLGSFGADPWTNSLDTTAYVYVPTQCGNSSGNNSVKCHLHINFHGCKQYRTHFNDHTQYVAHTELNQWAESNNIVVFYPQTVSNDLLGNPNGCFDWWGYAGSNYATKNGAQLSIVQAAVASLLGN